MKVTTRQNSVIHIKIKLLELLVHSRSGRITFHFSQTGIIQIIVRLAVHDKRLFQSTRRRNTFKNVLFMSYRVRKSSIFKLHEAIEETKTKIYCQTNVCRTWVLAEPMTTKVGLTKDGSQAKGLTNSEKNVTILTNLEQICNGKFIGLNSKPNSTQHKLTCALKHIRFVLLPLQNRLTVSKSKFSCSPVGRNQIV